MNETWDFVSFKDLIVERKDKFEPNSPEIEGLTKIEKIDFSEGRLHLGEYEPTKTQQIIVQPGDFVFSGLNIEKGAVAFNETGQRLVVSANYSTCQYDDRKVSLDFFKHYMRSSNFQRLLKDNLKKDYGFTRPKHLLPLTFSVPKSKEEQSLIVRRFERSKNTLTQVTQEIAHQVDLVAKLKQAILQEAITGRLTAGWRAAQTHVEPASQLLARIRAEKARLVAAKKLRPEKPAPPIPESEVPFALPECWEWCRLGELGASTRGKTPIYAPETDRVMLNQKCVRWGSIELCHAKSVLPLIYTKSDEELLTRVDDLLVNSTGEGTIGRSSVVNKESIGLLYDTHVLCFRPTSLNYARSSYLMHLINSECGQFQINAAKGAQTTKQTELGTRNLNNLQIPLPPLREQTEIVARVEGLMERSRELEAEVERSRAHAAALLQAVLREAFAPAA